MKNLSKILYKGFTAMALGVALTCASPVLAQKNGTDQTGRIEALDEMTFIDMLNSVEIDKGASTVQKFQNKEAKSRLLNGKFKEGSGCTVESYRNKEVLLVTIPAHLLYGPNETELLPTAAEYLSPIRRYLKDPDMYRVLLVMHTDNTGSETYREKITEERVDAVFDWFDNSGSDTRYLFSYAMGDEMPLPGNDNTSIEMRDKSRRLEIYLMPGKKMADQAKSGRIAF